MACGGLMETGIRSNVAPERLAAAPIVVTGKQTPPASGAEDATPLPERVGVPTSIVDKIRSVRRRFGRDRRLHVRRLSRRGAAEGHNWSSAALAPYR